MAPNYPGRHLHKIIPPAPVDVPIDMQKSGAELEVVVQERIAPNSQKLADAFAALANITEKTESKKPPIQKEEFDDVVLDYSND